MGVIRRMEAGPPTTAAPASDDGDTGNRKDGAPARR